MALRRQRYALRESFRRGFRRRMFLKCLVTRRRNGLKQKEDPIAFIEECNNNNPYLGKSRKHAKSNPQKDPAKTDNKRTEVNTATIKDTQNTCIYRGANKTNHTQ